MLDFGNGLMAEVMGSLEVPPAWTPEDDNRYLFGFWLADETMWATAREVLP